MKKILFWASVSALISVGALTVFVLQRHPKTIAGANPIASSHVIRDLAKPQDTRFPVALRNIQDLNLPPGVRQTIDSDPIKVNLEVKSALTNALYRVQYNGKVYVFRLNISHDYEDAFRNLPHTLHENGDNVSSFVIKGDPYIIELVRQAKEFVKNDKDVNVRDLLLAFVKQIPYNSDAYTGKLEYPKYPVETLLDQSGDCEDLSILAVNLVGEAEGYDKVVFVFHPEHMGIAVLPSKAEVEAMKDTSLATGHYDREGEEYFYMEVTDPSWVLGQIPDVYRKSKTVLYPIS